MKNNNLVLFSGILCTSTLLISFAIYRKMPRIGLGKYTKDCLYLGILDDTIARMRFENYQTNVVFPPKREAYMYRYQMHLRRNRKCTAKELDAEVVLYEKLLKEEIIYANNKNDNLQT